MVDSAGHLSTEGAPNKTTSLHPAPLVTPPSPHATQAPYPDFSTTLRDEVAASTSNNTDTIDVSHVKITAAKPTRALPAAGATNAPGRLSDLSPAGLHAAQLSPTSPSRRLYEAFSKNKENGAAYGAVSPSEEMVNEPKFKKTDSGQTTRSSIKQKLSMRPFSRHGVARQDIAMVLLTSAEPMATIKKTNVVVQVDEQDELVTHGGYGFDVSSFIGPYNPASEPEMTDTNRKEAAGILTGGLGAGVEAGTTLTSTDLMLNIPQTYQKASSPISKRMTVARRMTLRYPSSPNNTIRDLGQNEANRRGEVIRVIMDTPVDISSLNGVDGLDRIQATKDSRSSTFSSKFNPSNVETFYPHANWKPFSMRWPYLTALVVASTVLAIAQEYVYQKSMNAPLFQFTSPGDIPTWDYFCFKYMPTGVAVLFGIMWQITDFEVKRLEAYYQLSRDGGALAAESINVNYITFLNFLRPVQALNLKHYAVAVSSMATLLAVSLVPTLQSASVELIPDRATRIKIPHDVKGIVINGVFSRCLSATLLLCAVFGCILAWQLQRRPSGLVADVKGIAGIAAMANKSHILMDFREMDTATPEVIHQKLKTRRYMLRNSSLASEENISITQADKDKHDQRRSENPHPPMLRLQAGIPFLALILLLMAAIPTILFYTPANTITENAPWVLTLWAVAIKLGWGTLDTDVRMMEPFYILSRRRAAPKVLTLDYTAMAIGYMPFRALLNGHYLVALVGLGSVMAEGLTVCVAAFSTVSGADFAPRNFVEDESDDSGEETFASFWVTFSLAVIILLFLACVASLVYLRRRNPFLPRQPSSIASVLAFIHQSKMLYDFVGTEKMDNDEMVARLMGIGKVYGLGWFRGRDGELHCGVDEEELLGDYRYGYNARDATMPWSTDWEVY